LGQNRTFNTIEKTAPKEAIDGDAVNAPVMDTFLSAAGEIIIIGNSRVRTLSPVNLHPNMIHQLHRKMYRQKRCKYTYPE
jgi:hypothetical protein